MSTSAQKSLLDGAKLTYFDLPGRAEAIRMAFAVGGLTFEDQRISFGEWGALKATMPLPFLPCLTLKGAAADGSDLKLFNHRAILRVVGKEVGLYPQDTLQAALVDEVFDVLEDIFTAVNETGRGMEQAAKEAARADCVTKPEAKAVKLLHFVNSNIKGTFFNGEALTVADLLISVFMNALLSGGLFDGVPSTFLEPFPKIQQLLKNVAKVPALVAYYDLPAHCESGIGKKMKALRSD